VWIEDAVPGREPATGGCGKELMLIVLRTVFSARVDVDFERDEEDRNVGRLGVDDDCWVVGNADGRGLEGGLSFGGLCRSVMIFDGPAGTGRLFLGGLFAVGSGGRADVGGPKIGGDRYGRVDAIVADITLQSSRGRPAQQGAGPAVTSWADPGSFLRYCFCSGKSAIKSYVRVLPMCAALDVWRKEPQVEVRAWTRYNCRDGFLCSETGKLKLGSLSVPC
jgi:hypothetical protein